MRLAFSQKIYCHHCEQTDGRENVFEMQLDAECYGYKHQTMRSRFVALQTIAGVVMLTKQFIIFNDSLSLCASDTDETTKSTIELAANLGH